MQPRSKVFYQTEKVDLGAWTRHGQPEATEPRPEVVLLDLLPLSHVYLRKGS